MELKVVCNCGQKYKFDVEPANGRMPFAVNCPICGVDGTPLANALLTQSFPKPTAAPVAVVAPPALPAPMVAPPRTPALAGVLTRPKSPGEFNMGLGLLGAFLGAGLGAGIMYGFFMWKDFRFPLMGTGIGALAGLGARTLYKGRNSTLGAITGGIALAATAGTLFFMYGELSVINIITLLVSVSVAYRISG